MYDPTVAAAAPVAEIERRIHWRVMAMLVFLGMLLALASLAVYTVVVPPPILSGLPSDPDVAAAVAMVQGRWRVDAGELRFHSALLGDNRDGVVYVAGDEPDLRRVEDLLGRARGRMSRDPRLTAARATIDLVRRRYAGAERDYASALDRGSRYGEARLGLGLAIALGAQSESDPLRQRRRLLQAIAQFASIDEADPAFETGLFNRALLLDRVGRHEEARRVAASLIARAEGERWADPLRAIGAAAISAN